MHVKYIFIYKIIHMLRLRYIINFISWFNYFCILYTSYNHVISSLFIHNPFSN